MNHRHNWTDVTSKKSIKLGLAIWACKCHKVALLGVSKEVGLAMFATTTTSFLVSWIIWAWETL